MIKWRYLCLSLLAPRTEVIAHVHHDLIQAGEYLHKRGNQRRNCKFDEAHLHVAQNNGVSVHHGRHWEAFALLSVSLCEELFHH